MSSLIAPHSIAQERQEVEKAQERQEVEKAFNLQVMVAWLSASLCLRARFCFLLSRKARACVRQIYKL